MNDHTEGTVDELKGKAEQAYGNVTDDEDAQAQGQVDQAKGHGKKAVGDLKDAANEIFGNNS